MLFYVFVSLKDIKDCFSGTTLCQKSATAILANRQSEKLSRAADVMTIVVPAGGIAGHTKEVVVEFSSKLERDNTLLLLR